MVLRDVRDRILDDMVAGEVYAVVIRDGHLDEEATQRLRGSRAPSENGYAVRYDETRLEYERGWPSEAASAFAMALLAVPPGLRRATSERALRLLQQHPKLIFRDIEELSLIHI